MAVIRGNNGNNVLNGTAGRDWLYGLLGNDTVRGGAGNDYLAGNDGNDKLYGDAGDDQLYGGKGLDRLEGGEGDDLLHGGYDTQRDTLLGGNGDDAVWGFANDHADGGGGMDTLIFGFDPYDFGTGPAVRYNVDLSGIDNATSWNTGYNGLTAMNFERADVFIANAAALSSIVGSDGDDTISVSVVTNAARGANIRGGAGDDEIIGSDKADQIRGDAGTDILYGGGGADTMWGGAGSDLFQVMLEANYPGLPPQAVDRIADFNAAQDYFLVTRETFLGSFKFDYTGVNQANPLVSGANPQASSAGQFLYNTTSGMLSYDGDGKGGAAPVDLFILNTKPALAAENFIFDF